jgi:hypothetical protein
MAWDPEKYRGHSLEEVILLLGAKTINGRKPIRFAKNIIEPDGPPVPIYPDGTFAVNPRPTIPGATPQPSITGTPSGSFCPVGPGHVPPTAEQMAQYCGVSVEKYLAGLPAVVAALNGQSLAQPGRVVEVGEIVGNIDDWTAQVPAAEAAAFAHWQQFGKGPNRDAKRWAALSSVAKHTHQKAAKAAAK